MKKEDLYQVDRFTPIELMKVHTDIEAHAVAIKGMPQNHGEVFNKRGWMLPFLFAYDSLLWKRWDYWFEIIEKGTIEGSGPIPQIEWSSGEGVQATKKMLRKCLEHHDSTIDKFAQWLIWSLSIDKEGTLDGISADLNEHYYKHFDLFLVLNYPTDYLSGVLSEETGKGYKGALGYYPTPFHIVEFMTAITFTEDKDYKKEIVNDPCLGCGAMLLPASNYTLRGGGQDISRIAVSLATIQTYWYAPWYAFHPSGIEGFSEKQAISLSGEKSEVEGQLVFSM